MDHLYPDMLKVNSNDDIQRWWEVIDRTIGEVVPVSEWDYRDVYKRQESAKAAGLSEGRRKMRL